MNYWTVGVSARWSNKSLFISSKSNSEDVLHERRLKLRGNQMISDLFQDIADVPLPPPNQWDPSHKSVLLSSFSRTPRILWLQRGSGISQIIDQLWYVTHSLIDNNVTAEGYKHHIMVRYPEWNTGCSEADYTHRFRDCSVSVVKLRKSGNSKLAFLVRFVRRDPFYVERLQK